MSQRLAVVVIVGAVFEGHFTLVNAAVYDPAPVLKIKINDFPAVAVGIVNVQLPVSVQVCTVPLVNDRVCDVPLLPIATTLST